MAELPEGYGSIYCTTWFGDYKNIQYSITSKPDCILPLPIQDYITRVEADGGTVEGKECISNNIVGWGYDLFTYVYFKRVTDDGGTIEGRQCVQDKIDNLKTI